MNTSIYGISYLPGNSIVRKKGKCHPQEVGVQYLGYDKILEGRVKANAENGVIIVDGSLVDFNS